MNIIGKWKDKVAHYLDVRLSLIKLSFIERSSLVLSYLIFTFIALFLSMAVLLFMGIGLGEFLAEVLDSKAGGFFMTGGIFLVFAGVMFVLRKQIINAFAGVFVRIMTESEDDETPYEQKTSNNKVEVE